MPYRRVRIGGQDFIARVSDAAVMEWYENRLRRPGDNNYPNRPPDIDTEHFRAWVPHPGEDGQIPERPFSGPSFPVITRSDPTLEGQQVLVLLEWESTHYRARVRLKHPYKGGRDWYRSFEGMTDDEAYEAYEAVYQRLIDEHLLPVDLTAQWTYVEYEEQEQEVEAAYADLRAWFNLPDSWPERANRPVN